MAWFAAHHTGMVQNVSRAVVNYVLIAALCAALWFAWGKQVADDLGLDLSWNPAAADQQISPERATDALTKLDQLAVKGRSPKTGYSREVFYKGWTDPDGNGCNTRQDVLIRDMQVAAKDGCKVTAARITDPYTGTEITNPSDLDIDHVVALSDAWQKGASQWDDATRRAFAQDPDNLLAVSASANRQKGDGDAATWLPSNKPYRCTYVAHQINVKTKYGLAVTQAEADAMKSILNGCTN